MSDKESYIETVKRIKFKSFGGCLEYWGKAYRTGSTATGWWKYTDPDGNVASIHKLQLYAMADEVKRIYDDN